MKNYIVKTSKGIVYLRNGITAEEEAEVRKLYSKWEIKRCKPPKKKPEKHVVNKEFNISYDEVQKEDMIKYIKEYVDDPNALKEFAIASHKTKKGQQKIINKTINNKEVKVAQYFHLSAKDYFFEKYFPEKWEEILKMKEDRQKKFVKKKSEEAIAKENMELELQKLLGL